MTQNSFRVCFVFVVMVLLACPLSAIAQSGEKAATEEKKEVAAAEKTDTKAGKTADAKPKNAETASDADAAEKAPVTETESAGEDVAPDADPAADADAAAAATEEEDVAAESAVEASDEASAEPAPQTPEKQKTEATADASTKKQTEASAQTESDATSAQDVEVVVDPVSQSNFVAKGVPRTDRVVNILTTQTVRPGALVLTVDHRAHESFLSGEDAWFDYLGLDSGSLKIGIGLRLGLKDYLDFGLYRLSNGTDLFDVYEFDTKVRFLNQDEQFVNASLRIGASWFVQQDRDDASGFFSQLNVDRRLFGTLLIGAGFAFHTDSTNDRKMYEDKDPSAAVLGYAEWRPVRRFSLNAEMAANVAGYGSKFPIFAFSARFLTHRHSFALVVANSQYMNADGIVTNSWRAFDELVFGFQIVREFNLVD
ncbi:MAG: hypothetical protein JXX29_07170 [Deltaproteobacteria bacterium]|nr:hypothetical protein [Deltaproteobacteria bacterium]MBN2671435.1 hypothetical protein [Deltaproteobacteria bacterium]